MERYPVESPKSAEEVLAEDREILGERISPQQAFAEITEGTALLIDIRGKEQLEVDGIIPGAVWIPTNVLFTRCDPSSSVYPEGHRNEQIEQGNWDQRLIILCNQGWQSSHQAALLKGRMGFSNVTDVDGGFEAWRDAGLPVQSFQETPD